MKRIVTLFLIFALTAAFAVSCSPTQGGEDVTSPQGGEDSGSAVTDAPETEAEYKVPQKDYNGAEVVVSAIDYVTSGTTGSWVATQYCEAFMAEENGDPLNDSIYLRNRAVEEELNVKITVMPLTSFANAAADFRKYVMAGDDIIDYALMNGSSLPNLLGTGLVINLNILDLDFNKSWWDKGSIDEFEILGKLYAATGDISLYTAYAPITYFFNKALVRDLSLDDPYNAVRDGVWTLDAAFEMSAAAASDLNGDGKADIDDRFGMLCEAASLVYMVRSGGVRLTGRDSDGVPTIAVNNPQTTQLVEKCVPFMNDRTMNILAGNYSGYSNVFTDLMLPMFTDNRAMFYNNQLLVALNLRDMDADFGILPPPKYDEAQSDYICPLSDWWATFVVVPTTNASLEMTADVIQSTAYHSQQLMIPGFIDKTVLGKAVRDNDSAEMVNIILSNRSYDIGSIYNWGNINTMFNSIVTGSSSFASSYASIEAAVEAKLAETIENLRNE